MTGAAFALAVAAALLVAGGVAYSVFVEHVLDRGEGIVKESVKTKSARQPLTMAGVGVALLAASGCVGLAPPLRRRQLGPLAALGLPLAGAAVIGVGAFALGRAALLLAAATAAPALATCLVACLTPPRPQLGLVRFLLRSWMATGLLVGLGLLAYGGLSLAQNAMPRVPWSSLLAAVAVATVVQVAARYVGQHGATPSLERLDHQQVRVAQDTPAIRLVADRLHPFVEEGRAPDAYATLGAHLAAATGQPADAAPLPTPGAPAVPAAMAWLACVARAAAVAAPAALLFPGFWLAVALGVTGAVLPFTRAALAPRKEPASRVAWALATALLAAAGILAGRAFAPGTLLAWSGAALALPGLAVTLVTLRRRRAVPDLAHRRERHAQSLQDRWLRNALLGGGLAVGAVLVPAAASGVALLLGLVQPPVAWPPLLALALGGTLWAASAALAGPAVQRHRRRLAQQQAEATAQRRQAHRTFLERLEMT